MTKVNTVCLQRRRSEFESLKMNQTKSILDYFSCPFVATQQIKTNGEEISDIKIMKKIFRSLTSKFEHVVCLIKESKDIEEMDIDELLGSFIVYE